MIKTTEELKAWRTAKGWTQAQAAAALGYLERGYQDVERHPTGHVSERVTLAIVGYEAASIRKPKLALIDFNNTSDPAHCFTQYDLIMLKPPGADRALELLAWAERWGDALTNALRPQKAPKGRS